MSFFMDDVGLSDISQASDAGLIKTGMGNTSSDTHKVSDDNFNLSKKVSKCIAGSTQNITCVHEGAGLFGTDKNSLIPISGYLHKIENLLQTIQQSNILDKDMNKPDANSLMAVIKQASAMIKSQAGIVENTKYEIIKTVESLVVIVENIPISDSSISDSNVQDVDIGYQLSNNTINLITENPEKSLHVQVDNFDENILLAMISISQRR